MRFILFLMLFLQSACAMQMAQSQKVQRSPLQKTQSMLTSPVDYEQRTSHVNQTTNKPVYYDPKPQIVPVDAKSGKYELKWIGYDGEEKTVEYQQHDAVDVVVSARVSPAASGSYIYTYDVRNLPSSGTFVSSFIVQTLAGDAKGDEKYGTFVGEMSNNIPQFKEGRWINFGIMSYYKPQVVPGRNIELQLVSAEPPGLVECRVYGGPKTLQGVGEHIPFELEKLLPGYSVLPRGFTIGPVANLKNRSTDERVKYIQDALPQMRQLGWISEGALDWYKQNLKPERIEEVYRHAEADIKAERITSEVLSLIQMARS